mgnify:CR=1 FL=1
MAAVGLVRMVVQYCRCTNSSEGMIPVVLTRCSRDSSVNLSSLRVFTFNQGCAA